MHGGAAPQVRQAAAARLAALVDPALDTLQRALRSSDLGVAVRAARDVLDRAGYRASTQVDLNVDEAPRIVAIRHVIVDPDGREEDY
jgi:hypothetical protein